jgi:DNA-binding MarR family transcriptional regulator
MDNNDAKHIAALLERIGRLVSTEAHVEGLLPVQWEALRYLDKANRFSKTAAAVTAYLGITKGTVSQTLKTLENKGLLKKRVDGKDRRINHLSLTAKGRRLLGRDPLDTTIVAVNDLGDAAQRTLGKGLQTLLSVRLAAQDRKPFGQCRDCRYFARQHTEGNPHYCQLLQEKLAESDSLAICHEQLPA